LLVDPLAVNEGDAVADLERRTTSCDHSLHKGNRPVARVLEYHDITWRWIRIAIRPSRY
jgi:hypothetical protein